MSDDELKTLKTWLDQLHNQSGDMRFILAGNALIELVELRATESELRRVSLEWWRWSWGALAFVPPGSMVNEVRDVLGEEAD